MGEISADNTTLLHCYFSREFDNMEGDWDGENFEPKPVSVNKWEGEDEDDDVCDNWEDNDSEEKKDSEKQESSKIVNKKKDKPKDEKQKQHEEAEKLASKLPLTNEEKLAERQRKKNIQEMENLKCVFETFGVSEGEMRKEDFDKIRDEFSSKMPEFNKSLFFPTFAEDMIRNICCHLTSSDLKRLKITLDGLLQEKLKLEGLGQRAKKKPKSGKVQLRVEGGNVSKKSSLKSLYNDYGYNDYDDYDDFDNFM